MHISKNICTKEKIGGIAMDVKDTEERKDDYIDSVKTSIFLTHIKNEIYL